VFSLACRPDTMSGSQKKMVSPYACRARKASPGRGFSWRVREKFLKCMMDALPLAAI